MSFVNPITGEPVDQVLTEKQAKELGYMEFNFILRHLEDENEYCMLFIVGDKKILVDRVKIKYNQPTSVNQERVLADVTATIGERRQEVEPVSSASSCSLDDPGCLSCSG